MFYRLSKYNPKNRDVSGVYLKNEWTSISDIGKVFDDGLLNVEKYLAAEKAYCNVVKAILDEFSEKCFSVEQLERYFDGNSVYEEMQKYGIPFSQEDISRFDAISCGLRIPVDDLEKYLSYLLRESVWFVLVGRETKIVVGYDYYIHFQCYKPIEHLFELAEREGIYIEREDSCFYFAD